MFTIQALTDTQKILKHFFSIKQKCRSQRQQNNSTAVFLTMVVSICAKLLIISNPQSTFLAMESESSVRSGVGKKSLTEVSAK